MATYRKRGNSWNVQIRRGGFYASETFPTKLLAQAWVRKIEAELDAHRAGAVPSLDFSKAMERYADEVSPTKRGERWEVIRLTALARMPIGSVPLPDLNATHVAKWRDERLTQVSSESVNRDWNLLSHVCTIAVKEWRWLKHNPFTDVRRPKPGKPRKRIPTADEIEALKIAGGYHLGKLETETSRVVAAFLFAIETGMRAGEIASLENVRGSVAHLPETKNGHARDVPLSKEAQRILKQLPNGRFDMPSRDALWRKTMKAANVEGLTFHDSRHAAITKLSKKLSVLELARMVGHRNLNELMTYYNPDATDIAKKL